MTNPNSHSTVEGRVNTRRTKLFVVGKRGGFPSHLTQRRRRHLCDDRCSSRSTDLGSLGTVVRCSCCLRCTGWTHTTAESDAISVADSRRTWRVLDRTNAGNCGRSSRKIHQCLPCNTSQGNVPWFYRNAALSAFIFVFASPLVSVWCLLRRVRTTAKIAITRLLVDKQTLREMSHSSCLAKTSWTECISAVWPR